MVSRRRVIPSALAKCRGHRDLYVRVNHAGMEAFAGSAPAGAGASRAPGWRAVSASLLCDRRLASRWATDSAAGDPAVALDGHGELRWPRRGDCRGSWACAITEAQLAQTPCRRAPDTMAN